MPTYPVLSEDVGLRLKAIEMAARGEEDYLDHPDCPYSETLKNYLRKLLAVGTTIAEAVRVFDVPEGDKFDLVQAEIEATIEDMKGLERRMSVDGVRLDSGEQIQLIKAKTALLEKWISQKERILTLKEMAQFQSIVVGAMDEILTKDQIAEFRKRLAGLRSTQGGVVAANGNEVKA